jgi:hypothetical protein
MNVPITFALQEACNKHLIHILFECFISHYAASLKTQSDPFIHQAGQRLQIRMLMCVHECVLGSKHKIVGLPQHLDMTYLKL